ncbi:hypothetical protein N0V88_000028 [Collariella sp. IMI 366227]|nr:hypothetical protein N0V88_000028 [Collariella sp. IMI 366227]
MANGYLPSYQDATTKSDWLELAAPSIPIRHYPRLCLVSRRFHQHFAPRLWNDPLTTAMASVPESAAALSRVSDHMQIPSGLCGS